MDDECRSDRGVENFIGQKHLSTGHGQGCGVEVEKPEKISQHRQVRHKREERNQPDDVPGIVRREEEHQRRSEGESRGKKRRVSTSAEVIELIASLLTGNLPAPPQDDGEDRGTEHVVGRGGEVVQARDSLRKFKKKVTGTGGQPLFFYVATEETEDQRAGARISSVAECDYSGDGGGHLEVAASIQGRKQHQRVELEQDCNSQKEAGEDRLLAIAGEKRECNEGHGDGVEVARASDLPDKDGTPCVEKCPLTADA